jgi:hypothetical protein
MNKTIIGLFLIMIWSCNKVTPPKETDNTYDTCISFSIDTTGILTNKNLDRLILNLEAEHLTTHKKTEGIPGFIKVFLDSLTGTDFLMANPGEDWQATDAILGSSKLPDRQLIYLGLGNSVRYSHIIEVDSESPKES